RFSLYGVPLCREMSACDCSFVQMGLYCILRGQICVVVHCLTPAKSCKEIRVVSGELVKLGVQDSRSQFFVNKHRWLDFTPTPRCLRLLARVAEMDLPMQNEVHQRAH